MGCIMSGWLTGQWPHRLSGDCVLMLGLRRLIRSAATVLLKTQRCDGERTVVRHPSVCPVHCWHVQIQKCGPWPASGCLLMILRWKHSNGGVLVGSPPLCPGTNGWCGLCWNGVGDEMHMVTQCDGYTAIRQRHLHLFDELVDAIHL